MTINDTTNNALKLIFLGSAATLLGAYFFQYVLGMAPCKMCLWQRWPHMALIGLSALALIILPPMGRRMVLALLALIALIGMAVAIYHTGVEQKWWEGPTSCTGGPAAGTLEALREQLKGIAVIRCDEIPWSLFGISMAGYNALISAGLVVVAVIGARGSTREKAIV